MRPSNILPLASPNSDRTGAGRGYSSSLRVARMATSPRNDIAPRPPPSMNSNSSSSVGSEYATPRRNELSTNYGATSGSGGGSVLPVLTSPAHAQVQPLRTPSPNAFKRSVWTTPRSPREPREGAGGTIPGLQTPPRRNSRNFDDDDQFGLGENEYPYYSDESTTDSYLVNAEPTDPVTSSPTKPNERGDLEKSKPNDQAQLEQLAYMEQMYNTIQTLNAELEKERQDRTHLMSSRIEDEVTAALEYSLHGGLQQFTASGFDDPSMQLIVASTPSNAAGSRKSRPLPQPTRPAPPQSSKTLSKDQVELCATLGKNAELRIRTKEMEKNAEKTSTQLDQAQKQMKLVERRISNREEKLRILLKEKLHWQKELKEMRDQVVEEKMRQVELLRHLETGKRENAVQIEQMERNLRDIYDENQILRAQVAEAKVHITFQAKKMDELVRQARDEKEKLVSCIAETRSKFKEWKEGEVAALKNSRDQAVNNVKAEYDLKIARHQEEKHKLREKVKDLEVSLRLMQKDRTLSPLELSLRKATILGSKENAGTTEAELIEARSRIRELESLLDHSQEYQKRQENIIKVSEATISRLVQEREVIALENLSLQPLAGGFVDSSHASDGNAFPSSILNYPVSSSSYTGSQGELLKKQIPVKNASHEASHARPIANGSQIQPASSPPLMHSNFRSASVSEALPPSSSSAFSLMTSSLTKLSPTLADNDQSRNQPSSERGSAPRRHDTDIHADTKLRPKLTSPAPISEEDGEHVKNEANPGSLEVKHTSSAKETSMPPIVSSNEQFLASEVERLQKELAELKANGNGNKDKSDSTEEAREVEEPADSNLVHTNIDTFLEENSISEETEEEIEDGDGFDSLGGSTGEQKKTPVGNFEGPDCSQTALHFEEVSPNSQTNDIDRSDAEKDENILQTMEEDESDVEIEVLVQHFDNHNDSGLIGAAGDISGNVERYEECASDMPSSETAADKAVDGVEEKINLQDFEKYAEVGETQKVSMLESGKDSVDSLEKTDYPLRSYAIEEVDHVISAVPSSIPVVDGLDAVADPVACTAIDNMENAASEENEQVESHQIARVCDVAHEESTGGVCFEEKYFASEQISVLKTGNEYCDPTSSSDTDGTERHAMELEATIPDAKLVLGEQEEEWEDLCVNDSDDLSATLRDEEKSTILTTPAEDKQFLTDTAKRWEATASFDTEEKEQQAADAQAKASDETFNSDFEGKSQKAEETNALDEEGQNQRADDSDAHCTNLCDQEESTVSSLQAEDEEHLADSTERSMEIQQPLDANTSDILVLNDFQETTNNYPADDLAADPLEFQSGHAADKLNGHEDAMLDDMTVATVETSLNAEESADLEIDRVESDIVTLGESCAVLPSACGNAEATEDKQIENLCVGASYEVKQLRLEETRMGNRSSEAETPKDQSDGSSLITVTAGANSDERLQGEGRSETSKAAVHDPRLENPVFEESNTRDDFDDFVDDKAVRIPDAEQKDADEAFQKGMGETDAEQCGLIFYNDGKVCDGINECLTYNPRLEQDVQEKIVGFVASNFVTKTIRKGIHHAVIMDSYNRKYVTKTFVSAVESTALRSVVAQLMRPRTPDAVMELEQSSSSEILPVVEFEAFENREVDVSHQEDDTICGTLIIDSLDSQPASESALDEDLLTQSDANEYDFASGTTGNDTMLPNDKVTSSSDRSPLTSTENDQLCVADGEESGERSELQQNCGPRNPVQDYFNDETEVQFVVTSADDDLGLAPSQILQLKSSDIMPSVVSDEWSDVNELALCAEEANISDTARKSFVEAFVLEVQDEAVSRIVANHGVLHFVKKNASANDGLPVRKFERPEAESDFSSNAKEDCSSLSYEHDAPESSQSETLDQDNLESNDESAANEKGDVSRNAPDITIEGCAVRLPESIDQESSVVESAVESEVGNVDDTTRPNALGFDAAVFINVVESEAIAAIIKSAASTLDAIESETTIKAEVVLSSQSTHEHIQSESSAVVTEVGSPRTEETRSVTETPTMNSSNHVSTPQSDEGMAAEADDSALEFATEAHAVDSAVVNHEEMTPRRCSSPDVVTTGEDRDRVINARVAMSEIFAIVPAMDDLCCDIEKKAAICNGAKDCIMRGHVLESSSVSVEKDEDQHLEISLVEVVASDGERTEVEGMADCDVEDGISTCHADDVAQMCSKLSLEVTASALEAYAAACLCRSTGAANNDCETPLVNSEMHSQDDLDRNELITNVAPAREFEEDADLNYCASIPQLEDSVNANEDGSDPSVDCNFPRMRADSDQDVPHADTYLLRIRNENTDANTGSLGLQNSPVEEECIDESETDHALEKVTGRLSMIQTSLGKLTEDFASQNASLLILDECGNEPSGAKHNLSEVMIDQTNGPVDTAAHILTTCNREPVTAPSSDPACAKEAERIAPDDQMIFSQGSETNAPEQSNVCFPADEASRSTPEQVSTEFAIPDAASNTKVAPPDPDAISATSTVESTLAKEIAPPILSELPKRASAEELGSLAAVPAAVVAALSDLVENIVAGMPAEVIVGKSGVASDAPLTQARLIGSEILQAANMPTQVCGAEVSPSMASTIETFSQASAADVPVEVSASDADGSETLLTLNLPTAAATAEVDAVDDSFSNFEATVSGSSDEALPRESGDVFVVTRSVNALSEGLADEAVVLKQIVEAVAAELEKGLLEPRQDEDAPSEIFKTELPEMLTEMVNKFSEQATLETEVSLTESRQVDEDTHDKDVVEAVALDLLLNTPEEVKVPLFIPAEVDDTLNEMVCEVTSRLLTSPEILAEEARSQLLTSSDVLAGEAVVLKQLVEDGVTELEQALFEPEGIEDASRKIVKAVLPDMHTEMVVAFEEALPANAVDPKADESTPAIFNRLTDDARNKYTTSVALDEPPEAWNNVDIPRFNHAKVEDALNEVIDAVIAQMHTDNKPTEDQNGTAPHIRVEEGKIFEEIDAVVCSMSAVEANASCDALSDIIRPEKVGTTSDCSDATLLNSSEDADVLKVKTVNLASSDENFQLNLELPDADATKTSDFVPGKAEDTADEVSIAITTVNTPTDTVEKVGENKVPAKVTWALPECEKDNFPAPKQPTKAEKRRASRRLMLDQSRFASMEMMRDPTLSAYDAHHEHSQPFALLDDSILSIDPNARHLQHDENDQAKCTETEILAKRKNFDHENHRKTIAYRSTPAFNYMPVLIRFQWSDFVVATPISLSSDPADKKPWNPASPVKKMRLLVKKGTKLPCGTYVIISAFIRPLEDGNENLRVHIYDSEWVEEFQYDFFEDHLKECIADWSGRDEDAKKFMMQLEFRRQEGGIVIKLPDKAAHDQHTTSAPSMSQPQTLPMESSDGKEHSHHGHSPPSSHRNSRHSQRPSTTPPVPFLPFQPRSLPNLSDSSAREEAENPNRNADQH